MEKKICRLDIFKILYYKYEPFQAKEMFDEAAKDIKEMLIQRSQSGLTYIAEWKNGRLEHKMEHLACFTGGLFGLAAENEKDENRDRWMSIAKDITSTCHESYDRSDTKLGPDAFWFTDLVDAKALSQNEMYVIYRFIKNCSTHKIEMIPYYIYSRNLSTFAL